MRKTSLIKTLALAVPFAMALTACSGSSSQTAETTTAAETTIAEATSSAETTTTAKETTTVAETTTVEDTTEEKKTTAEETSNSKSDADDIIDSTDEVIDDKSSNAPDETYESGEEINPDETYESGEETDPDETYESGEEINPDETAESDDYPEILQNLLYFIETGDKEVFDPENLSDADKAELKAAAEAAGGEIEFLEDGSIKMKQGEEYEAIIYPDGSVEGTDGDGNHYSISRSQTWPETELSSLIPVPDFKISQAITDDVGEIAVYFSDVTMEEAKAYVQQIIGAGFEGEETDLADYGFYSFTAANADNVSVMFYYMSSEDESECLLTVSNEASEDYNGEDAE